jgi:hypothetical protein
MRLETRSMLPHLASFHSRNTELADYENHLQKSSPERFKGLFGQPDFSVCTDHG